MPMCRSITYLGIVLALLAGATVASAGEDGKPDEPRRAEVTGTGEAFGFKLYARLRSRTGNLVFSPQSIAAGLALAHAGARGETARQMAAVLQLPADRPGRIDAAGPLPAKPEPDGAAEGCELRPPTPSGVRKGSVSWRNTRRPSRTASAPA